VAETPRQALNHETHAPGQLVPFETGAEQQRRIVLHQPLHDLERRARRCPRLGLRYRNLRTVGEAGLEPGPRLTIDDRHLVTLLGEIPRAGGADDAGTHDDHLHGQFPVFILVLIWS